LTKIILRLEFTNKNTFSPLKYILVRIVQRLVVTSHTIRVMHRLVLLVVPKYTRALGRMTHRPVI
jgi:hypothetical protein